MAIYRVNSDDLTALQSALAERDYPVYTLNGGNVTTKESFFQESLRSLPMGDGDADASNSESWRAQISGWDGFADFLSQGLSAHSGDKVIILWQQADQTHATDTELLAQASGVIAEVGEELQDEENGITDAPVMVTLFLLGKGTEFAPFDVSVLD